MGIAHNPKPYTVVGLNPDADWKHGMREASFVYKAKQDSPTVAGYAARRAIAAPLGCDPDDVVVLAVFPGHLRDDYEQELDNQEYCSEFVVPNDAEFADTETDTETA